MTDVLGVVFRVVGWALVVYGFAVVTLFASNLAVELVRALRCRDCAGDPRKIRGMICSGCGKRRSP